MTALVYKYSEVGACPKLTPQTIIDSPDIYQARIQSFIDNWNHGRHSKPLMGLKPFDVRVVYHKGRDLFSGNEYDFAQNDYVLEDDRNKTIIPTIHLTLFDIFTEKETGSLLQSVQRYKKIIDCSIWNYYVPIMISDDGCGFDFTRFDQAIKEIGYHYLQCRYSLNIAREYTDLHARLRQQCHLNGDHSAISPFLFHSEEEMKKKIADFRSIEDDKVLWNDEIKKYKWHFLLLDDKGIENLKCNGGQKSGNVNKLQVVTEDLCQVLSFQKDAVWFRNKKLENGELVLIGCGRVKDGKWGEVVYPNSPDEVNVVIDCVPNVDSALACMKANEFEVILLDYLLENEFGYDLLRKYKNRRNDFRIGPNRRCFFMFISAFTTAVHERMLEQGLNFSEPGLWYIGDGACPTNTPYLFVYQLLLLMQHRLTDLRKEKEGGFFTIIDLLEQIYVKEEQGTVRDKAHKRFNQVLFMRAKYKKLESDLIKEDEEKIKRGIGAVEMMNMSSSFLVYHTFKVVHHFSGAFFEHLQHLVYLTAFGTIRQWEDMWEEYIFIRKELCNYDDIVSGKKPQTIAKERGRGRVICDAIRDYIIDLKENNYR